MPSRIYLLLAFKTLIDQICKLTNTLTLPIYRPVIPGFKSPTAPLPSTQTLTPHLTSQLIITEQPLRYVQ
ncbi:hypothetical protein E6O75_ATG05043 [Venturia nashicola]|uniref:Uncharacterized protein n=1 Tax=Venturia nashicola TaxID=86259 RepID=A0A4Z1NZG4_9PEZI|nr:hypothetical protein E6O75_ATG05043 [Venturia nashicola]